MDSTEKFGAEPMDIDDEKITNTHVQNTSLMSNSIAGKDKLSLPNLVNKTTVLSPDFALPRSSSKLVIPSPRRSLRLSKQRSKPNLVNKETPGSVTCASDPDLVAVDKPFV